MKNCFLVQKKDENGWYMDDWLILSKYLNVTFSVFLNPIFSLFSIIINVITVIALKSKSIQKELKKQYNYLMIFSISNIFYISTIPINLINNCKYDNLFCSSLHDYAWTPYFAMVFNVLISNVCKTFSNSAYLMFILIRYIKISNTKNIILTKFNKISFKMYFLIAILLSLLCNAFICFEIREKQIIEFYSTNFLDASRDRFKTQFTDFEFKLFN